MVEVIVAEREYLVEHLSVRATVYKPIEESEGVWSATIRIVGIEPTLVDSIRGGDSLQALLLATQLLRVRLEELGRVLRWRGGEAGNTGIPRDIGWSYGLAFSKRMERLVDREAVKLLKLKAARRGTRKRRRQTRG